MKIYQMDKPPGNKFMVAAIVCPKCEHETTVYNLLIPIAQERDRYKAALDGIAGMATSPRSFAAIAGAATRLAKATIEAVGITNIDVDPAKESNEKSE